MKSFLSFLVVIALCGCSPSPSENGSPSNTGSSLPSSGKLSDEQKIKTWTIADWMHDIDEAKRLQDRSKLAYEAVLYSSSWYDGGKCWPRDKQEIAQPERVTTANTDHACLDKFEDYGRNRR